MSLEIKILNLDEGRSYVLVNRDGFHELSRKEIRNILSKTLSKIAEKTTSKKKDSLRVVFLLGYGKLTGEIILGTLNRNVLEKCTKLVSLIIIICARNYELDKVYEYIRIIEGIDEYKKYEENKRSLILIKDIYFLDKRFRKIIKEIGEESLCRELKDIEKPPIVRLYVIATNVDYRDKLSKCWYLILEDLAYQVFNDAAIYATVSLLKDVSSGEVTISMSRKLKTPMVLLSVVLTILILVAEILLVLNCREVISFLRKIFYCYAAFIYVAILGSLIFSINKLVALYLACKIKVYEEMLFLAKTLQAYLEVYGRKKLIFSEETYIKKYFHDLNEIINGLKEKISHEEEINTYSREHLTTIIELFILIIWMILEYTEIGG